MRLKQCPVYSVMGVYFYKDTANRTAMARCSSFTRPSFCAADRRVMAMARTRALASAPKSSRVCTRSNFPRATARSKGVVAAAQHVSSTDLPLAAHCWNRQQLSDSDKQGFIQSATVAVPAASRLYGQVSVSGGVAAAAVAGNMDDSGRLGLCLCFMFLVK